MAALGYVWDDGMNGGVGGYRRGTESELNRANVGAAIARQVKPDPIGQIRRDPIGAATLAVGIFNPVVIARLAVSEAVSGRHREAGVPEPIAGLLGDIASSPELLVKSAGRGIVLSAARKRAGGLLDNVASTTAAARNKTNFPGFLYRGSRVKEPRYMGQGLLARRPPALLR